jgi:hypothetical protein
MGAQIAVLVANQTSVAHLSLRLGQLGHATS